MLLHGCGSLFSPVLSQQQRTKSREVAALLRSAGHSLLTSLWTEGREKLPREELTAPVTVQPIRVAEAGLKVGARLYGYTSTTC